MPNFYINCLYLIVLIIQPTLYYATRITGTYRTDEFFLFINKFGFQKTDKHSQKDSFGYIFGNITSNDDLKETPITLAVQDKYTFMDFYGNRSIKDRDVACARMFEKIEKIAFDSDCNPNAKGDYLRKIPCKPGMVCKDEERSTVIPGSQLTFVISDLKQPRFWYVSIVACYQNVSTCTWHYYDYRKFNHAHAPVIKFDLYLVNGNPKQTAAENVFDSTISPLEYHFSFDQQYILQMYLIFFAIYLVLVPLQIAAARLQKHPVTRLFTISLTLEFISLCFMLGHWIRYAFDGVGNENLSITGSIFDIFSRTSFMLILLLLAKGWAVTRLEINRTDWLILMLIWIPYCIFHIFLYIWNRVEVDIISDIDEYQTWPGWLVLACRSLMMLWFLYELRNTMKYEHSSKKLDFLLHFGASSLVWFIYLPIVALVALQVSPLWRYKLILGITNSADCLAYCVMMGLLWPNRTGQYLLLAASNYAGMDELDEFNEAPHVLPRQTFNPALANSIEEEDENGNDADSETLVLSTDDLLVNNHGDNAEHVIFSREMNGHTVHDFTRNSRNVA